MKLTNYEIECMAADAINGLARDVHALAIRQGWWDAPRNDGELLALIHSEISECLEALRHGNPPDDKLPHVSGATAELADAVIRIMDMAAARGWDLGQTIIEKHRYNATRPKRHGKQF